VQLSPKIKTIVFRSNYIVLTVLIGQPPKTI